MKLSTSHAPARKDMERGKRQNYTHCMNFPGMKQFYKHPCMLVISPGSSQLRMFQRGWLAFILLFV